MTGSGLDLKRKRKLKRSVSE